MIRIWRGFVSACARPVDTRPLAALRILLPLCVVLDLARAVWLGLHDDFFRTWEHGGLSVFSGEQWLLDGLGPDAGQMLIVVVVVCMLLASSGVAVRPALLVGVLAYAQLGHLYPPGDRGIDRIIRVGLLVLLCSQSHRRWSLGNRLRGREAVARAPAAPQLVLMWFLVLVYMAAGTSKLIQQPDWLASSGMPVLYRIMTDPLAGALDHVAWAAVGLPFFIGGWVTVVFEVGALVLLTRWRCWWGLIGIAMHLGIALTMHLGMFSVGMLCFYVVVMADWWVPALDRRSAPGPG